MAVSKANMLESMGWLKDLQDTANEEKFVQKEEGKQLSSNDFSDADKAKLDSLANFEPATATKLGGIKVGNGLEIQNDGTLSIDYDLPTASKTRKGGVKVGDGLDMDGKTLKCTVEPGITNLVSHTQNGIMRATDKVKLDTIEDYAQVNTIERIKVNNSTLTIINKTVDIDLSGYVQGVNIAGAYHYKGTVNSYANLPTSGQVAGDVYNVRTAGGQDINGDDIKAGDNVAWTGVGWDVLAGTVDLSKFVEKVPGKDLSTEDFTTALKSKLEGLSNYSLPTASATTKGGVKVGNGLSMNGDTLNCTIQGGTNVIAGAGLAFNNDTLNVTMTAGTNIVAGKGLSFNGDTLNCTLSGGGDTYTDFTGASTNFGGTSGLVPSPAAGDNTNFLRGDGTWAPATQNITVYSAAVTVPPSPQGYDGTLWEDTLSNGDPVLKFRYGDYEFNFNYDTKNYTGTTPPPITPEDAQLYMLDTVPSTDEGTLWYNVTQSNFFPIPALCLHAGSFDYGYNYDTITYKGSNTGLVSYLPLQQGFGDAMSNGTLTSSKSTPSIESFKINGVTYRGLRNVNLGSTGSTTGTGNGYVFTLPTTLNTYTVDFWFSVSASNAINASSFITLVGTSYSAGGYTYYASNSRINYTATNNTHPAPGRYHLAFVHAGIGSDIFVYCDGKFVATPSTNLKNYPLEEVRLFWNTPGTGAASYTYIDRLRVWNKVVWDGNFEVPQMSDY